MPFWHLCQLKCFFPHPFPSFPSLSFFPPQHLLLPSLEKVCVYFTFLLFFPPPWFPLNLASVFASGCLSQIAVKRCDNAFRFRPCLFYDPLISFFPFSCFFLQGLAHLTLKSQGMGPLPFPFLFLFRFPLYVPNPCFHNSFDLPYFPSISLSRWFLCPFILCYLCVLHVRLLTPVLSTGPAPGAAPLMATPAAGNALTFSLTCLFWSWCRAVTNRTQNAQSQSSAVILAVWLY